MRIRPWVLRAVAALVVGLAEPYLEIAWKCRRGFETSEACVWGRAYLPLGRWMGLLLIAPATFVVLTLVARAWTSRRPDSPPD
jgi:hypothetical protein